MNNEPLVSIILPTFNSEKFIKKTIESLLMQSYKNYEIILIDNNSTDRTVEIIKEFIKKGKLKIVLLKNKHRNLSLSLNMGIKKANGKYIMRMDSDDYALKNRIKESVRFLKKNPNIKLIGSNILLTYYGLKIKKIMPKSYDSILSSICFMNPFIHPTIMFDKDIINNTGLYNTKNSYSEDYEYWSRVIKEHKVSNLQKITLNYNININQVSKINNNSKIEEIYKIQSNLLKYFKIDLKNQFHEIHKNLINVTAFNYNYKTNYKIFLKNCLFFFELNKLNKETNSFEVISFNKVQLILLFNICLYFSNHGLKIFYNFLRIYNKYIPSIRIGRHYFYLFFICFLRIKNVKIKKYINLQFSNTIYKN